MFEFSSRRRRPAVQTQASDWRAACRCARGVEPCPRRLRHHRAPAAVPLSLASSAVPLEIADARYYADESDHRTRLGAGDAGLQARQGGGLLADAKGKPRERAFLAISGGGDDGAYGAGLLVRLERARRPAGIRHRHRRQHRARCRRRSRSSAPSTTSNSSSIYTETSAGDVFQARGFMAAVADDAMADSTPLRNRISSFVDARMVQRLAEEYEQGPHPADPDDQPRSRPLGDLEHRRHRGQRASALARADRRYSARLGGGARRVPAGDDSV